MAINDFRPIAQAAARAASDKKADDIIILDVRKASDVADYMVVVSAGSTAQMRAVYEAVVEALDSLSVPLLRQDGHAGGRWIALDYGGMLMHILMPEAREFYRLEHLWEQPRRVHWVDGAGKTKDKKRRGKS